MAQPPASGDRSTGPDFLQMMVSATRWLEANAAAVNALNVYPVPDGDTGTNMVLTLRTALREAEKAVADAVGPVARALAQGALLGARGNSGVILSQYLQGLAKGLTGCQRLQGRALASALAQASTAAYGAMSAPVEGTILTVSRAAAEGAVRAARRRDATLASTLLAAAEAAQEALERTPELLPVLKEAGVVDAGGQGLALLLRAAADFHLGQEPGPLLEAAGPVALDRTWLDRQRDLSWGFCTEFVLQEPKVSAEVLRGAIARFGQSESLVEGEGLLRVHLHTGAPEEALAWAGAQGTLAQVSIRDMDQQHRQFLATHQEGVERPLCGVVAVAAGTGFVRVLRSLGASSIIWGGQTMNPSAEEIAEAADSLPVSQVIVLPNNKNIVPTAHLAAKLSSARLHVVPSLSLPQGIAALLAYNPQQEVEANVARMLQALGHLRWGEVTRAVRGGRSGDVEYREGEAIGLLEGELVLAAPDLTAAVCGLVERMRPGGGALLTLYRGAGVTVEEAAAAAAAARERCPQMEVETVEGGQPFYPYILSLE